MLKRETTNRGNNRLRRCPAWILALTCALTALAAGPLVTRAGAATPQLTVSTCTNAIPPDCYASGVGFAPSEALLVHWYVGTALFATSSVTTSAPTESCVYGVKPVCHLVPGGTFYVQLTVFPALGFLCELAAGTVTVTTASGALLASQPMLWFNWLGSGGFC